MFQHQFFQALVQDMRVDFRGRNVGMSQQGLDRAQIRAIGQQMRREGMAQRVWRDFVRGNTTGPFAPAAPRWMCAAKTEPTRPDALML